MNGKRPQTMAKKGFKLKAAPKLGGTGDASNFAEHRTQRTAPGTTEGLGRRRNTRNNTQNKMSSGDYKVRANKTGDISEYAATNRTVSRGRTTNSNRGDGGKLFSNGESSYKTISLNPGVLPGSQTPSQNMISGS